LKSCAVSPTEFPLLRVVLGVPRVRHLRGIPGNARSKLRAATRAATRPTG
jgi:hypothetical protein